MLDTLKIYARKMYPHYNHLNVPTWIIGPALGAGSLIDRPADVLKVWPACDSPTDSHLIKKGDSDKAMEVESNENATLLKLLKNKSRTKTGLREGRCDKPS